MESLIFNFSVTVFLRLPYLSYKFSSLTWPLSSVGLRKTLTGGIFSLPSAHPSISCDTPCVIGLPPWQCPCLLSM